MKPPFRWKDKPSEFGAQSSMNLTLTGKVASDLRVHGYVVLTSLHPKSSADFFLEWRMLKDSFANYAYLKGTLEEVKKSTLIKLMENLVERTKKIRTLHEALLIQLESTNE